jgi:hypothetical protein
MNIAGSPRRPGWLTSCAADGTLASSCRGECAMIAELQLRSSPGRHQSPGGPAAPAGTRRGSTRSAPRALPSPVVVIARSFGVGASAATWMGVCAVPGERSQPAVQGPAGRPVQPVAGPARRHARQPRPAPRTAGRRHAPTRRRPGDRRAGPDPRPPGSTRRADLGWRSGGMPAVSAVLAARTHARHER